MITGAESQSGNRLYSLDFFRGATMLLLIGESTLLYDIMVSPAFSGTWLAAFGINFHHHPWHGLRFWDLVQPFFMFIVGVAIPFAFARRPAGWAAHRHVAKRSLLLLLFGVTIYIAVAGHIVFQYWNVLAQLAFTYPVAYLLMRRSWPVQIGASLALILTAELLYRFAGIPGFDQPFTPDRNFGTWMDFVLMGKGTFEGGHWVAFNAVSTAAHTIWGVIAGQLLMSNRTATRKLALLVMAGLVCLAAGYGLDSVTPIIKRIATSSFVLASGGWTLLVLAACYYIVDVRGNREITLFARIVGMNSLFIFLFFSLGGAAAVRLLVLPYAISLFAPFSGGGQQLAASLLTWLALWGLCYWLYRKRIFINI